MSAYASSEIEGFEIRFNAVVYPVRRRILSASMRVFVLMELPFFIIDEGIGINCRSDFTDEYEFRS